MIAGRKVRLRRAEKEDHPIIYQWRNDPANKPFFNEEESISLDSHLAWHERVSQCSLSRFYVIDALVRPETFEPLDAPLLIGTTGLRCIDWRNRTAEYLWLLLGRTEYRGGGFGKESEFLLMDYAFNHLNLNKVWGVILTDNEVVLNLHWQMGFKQEGLLRKQVFKGGRYVDLVRIGLLAEEFNAIKESLSEDMESMPLSWPGDEC